MHLIYSKNPLVGPGAGLTLDVNGHRYVRASASDPFLIVDVNDVNSLTAGGVFEERSPGINAGSAILAFPYTDTFLTGDPPVYVTHARPSDGGTVGCAILNTDTDRLNYWTGTQWVNPDGSPA